MVNDQRHLPGLAREFEKKNLEIKREQSWFWLGWKKKEKYLSTEKSLVMYLGGELMSVAKGKLQGRAPSPLVGEGCSEIERWERYPGCFLNSGLQGLQAN